MARTPAKRAAQKRYEQNAKGKATRERYREKRQRLVELGRAVQGRETERDFAAVGVWDEDD